MFVNLVLDFTLPLCLDLISLVMTHQVSKGMTEHNLKENYSNGLFWESPYPVGQSLTVSQPQTDCNGDGQWQGVSQFNAM